MPQFTCDQLYWRQFGGDGFQAMRLQILGEPIFTSRFACVRAWSSVSGRFLKCVCI